MAYWDSILFIKLNLISIKRNLITPSTSSILVIKPRCSLSSYSWWTTWRTQCEYQAHWPLSLLLIMLKYAIQHVIYYVINSYKPSSSYGTPGIAPATPVSRQESTTKRRQAQHSIQIPPQRQQAQHSIQMPPQTDPTCDSNAIGAKQNTTDPRKGSQHLWPAEKGNENNDNGNEILNSWKQSTIDQYSHRKQQSTMGKQCVILVAVRGLSYAVRWLRTANARSAIETTMKAEQWPSEQAIQFMKQSKMNEEHLHKKQQSTMEILPVSVCAVGYKLCRKLCEKGSLTPTELIRNNRSVLTANKTIEHVETQCVSACVVSKEVKEIRTMTQLDLLREKWAWRHTR